MTADATRPHDFEDVLSRCQHAKRAGQSRATADCPCPGHKHPEGHLSLTDQGDKCLAKCHSLHSYEQVAAALGFDSLTYERAEEPPPHASRIVATYDYVDEEGSLLFQAVRYEPKDFRQRRSDGNGGWIWNLKDTRRVLFKLPDVLAAVRNGSTVYVVEGEKDALALQSFGLTATTNPMGAEKWRPEYSDALAGANVVVLPDNDDAGKKHADQVVEALRGIARSLSVLRLPVYCGVHCKDVSEWIAAGGTKAEFLESAVLAVPVEEAPAETSPLKRLPFRTARQVCEAEPEHTEWVVEGFLAPKAITELGAKVKHGKTTLALSMLADMQRGRDFLGLRTCPAPVLYLTEERSTTFAAELKRVHLSVSDDVHILSRHDVREVKWPDVVEQATFTAQETGARVIVVDTLSRWAGLKDDDENNAGKAAEAMDPLEQAAASGLAVLILRHDRKGGGELGDSGRGSSAFSGAADILLALRKATAEGHENRRTLEGLGRFEGTPATVTIEFDFASGRYASLGNTEEVERAEARQAIPEMLPRYGRDPMLKTLIEERLKDKCSRSTVKRALDELLNAKRILLVTGCGKNKKGHGYTLPQEDDADD